MGHDDNEEKVVDELEQQYEKRKNHLYVLEPLEKRAGERRREGVQRTFCTGTVVGMMLCGFWVLNIMRHRHEFRAGRQS